MQKIVQGVRTFQEQVFPGLREWFEQMANRQQKPRALFITCADSRVHPNMITQTEPGELFILRNAGNIIPPYGAANGGEGATVEYAVAVLGVKQVIVCGHSHCGAMNALLHAQNLGELPAVAAWFSHAEATRRIMRHKYADVQDPAELDLLAVQENVLVQLDNLRTHPAVAAGLASGDLNLYGWVYVIETGEVVAYEPKAARFVPVCEAFPCPMPVAARLHHLAMLP